MVAIWAYRTLLVLSFPLLGVLGLAVVTAVPGAIATDARDLPNLIAWAVALAAGIVMVGIAMLLRGRGRLGAAITLLAIAVAPAVLAIGFVALIALLFILKSL